MHDWKIIIFVNAIKTRIKSEKRTAEDIICDYIKLTEEEKSRILQEISISK